MRGAGGGRAGPGAGVDAGVPAPCGGEGSKCLLPGRGSGCPFAEAGPELGLAVGPGSLLGRRGGHGTGPALALHGVLGQTCVVLGGSPCEAGHPSLDLGESCFEDAALVFLSFPVDKKGNANLGRL